jgi:hypothetical protein
MLRNISILSLLLVFTLAFSACKKDGPTGCVITIKDLKERPVKGAAVLLHAKDMPEEKKEGDLVWKQTTDAQGKAYFEIPLEAIYTIEATKSSLYGKGRVRLKPNEVVEETVIIE